MEVLVVRHAPALDKGEASQQGMADRDRPLTTDGKTRMKRIARALSTRVPEVSVLMTSPWRRAVETGDLLQTAYGRFHRLETEALIPGAEPSSLLEQISVYAADPVVAIVGHEPHLSRWVSWCMTGSLGSVSELRSVIELRKGGACLLRFDGALAQARARLLWLMTPSLLRRL